MFEKLGIAIGSCGLVTAIVTLIAACNEKKKLDKKLEEYTEKQKKLVANTSKAIDDLADATPVDIREEMVEKAVHKAVDREVNSAVSKAVSDVKYGIRAEIDQEVRQEIVTQRDKIVEDVDRKLVEEVEKISREDISRDVMKKVTNMVIDRVDKDMSDIKETYSRKINDEVKDISRTYKSRLDLLTSGYDRDYLVWRLGRA